jgi:N-acetylglucosamine repressor
MNERSVFELIRRSGPTSRADLKRRMGVSAPTVSKAVAHLLRAGFLEEVGITPLGGAGRPVVVYQVARGSARVIGVAVGVRQCTVVAAGLDGQLDDRSRTTFDTPDSYPALIDAICRTVKQLARQKGITMRGVGISVPGETDVREQKVLLSPNLHILNGRSPGEDVRRRLGIETCLVHDVVGSCLAERQYGHARDLTDFVRIGVYEGFGVSVVTGGRLLEGARGLAAELGHVTVDLNGLPCGCGNRGCLETVATDAAFARLVSRKLGRTMQVEEVVAQARSGKIDIREQLDQTLAYLAVGLAAAINLFNPEAILLTSRMLDAAPDAFDRLQQMARARALKPAADGCRILRVEPVVGQGAVAAIIQQLTEALGPTFN